MESPRPSHVRGVVRRSAGPGHGAEQGDRDRVDLVRFHAADLVEHPQPRQGAVSDRQDTV